MEKIAGLYRKAGGQYCRRGVFAIHQFRKVTQLHGTAGRHFPGSLEIAGLGMFRRNGGQRTGVQYLYVFFAYAGAAPVGEGQFQPVAVAAHQGRPVLEKYERTAGNHLKPRFVYAVYDCCRLWTTCLRVFDKG